MEVQDKVCCSPKMLLLFISEFIWLVTSLKYELYFLAFSKPRPQNLRNFHLSLFSALLVICKSGPSEKHFALDLGSKLAVLVEIFAFNDDQYFR